MPNITSSDVINVALGEEGYIEKDSYRHLDSKTANAGSSNITKYGRDLTDWIGSPYCNGVAWCDMFVDWCFIKAALEKSGILSKSIRKAKSLLCGWSAYTPQSANFYKEEGRFHSHPKVGDQIFFRNSERICHTGIVIGVDSSNVYTIEGNTSSASGVVANGGCVRRKVYSLDHYRIAGYGRPNYDAKSSSNTKTSIKHIKNNVDDIVDEVIAGLWGSGDQRRAKLEAAGYNYEDIQSKVNKKLKSSSTSSSSSSKSKPPLAKYPPCLKIGSRGLEVTHLQKDLNYVLKKAIEVDGIFGNETDETLRQFQSKYKLVVDGEYGKNSMSQMKKLLK